MVRDASLRDAPHHEAERGRALGRKTTHVMAQRSSSSMRPHVLLSLPAREEG